MSMALIVVTAMIVACSAAPAWPSPSSTQSVAELSRCGANPSSLCLVSFGLDDNNRMLISFFIPVASFTGYSLKVQYNDVTAVYPCQVLKDFRTSIYCTGEPMPLGASISIDIYSTAGNVLLARGSFVIDAMAIPTPPIAAPASTATEIPSVAPSNPTYVFIATPIPTTPTAMPLETPTPWEEYPNP